MRKGEFSSCLFLFFTVGKEQLSKAKDYFNLSAVTRKDINNFVCVASSKISRTKLTCCVNDMPIFALVVSCVYIEDLRLELDYSNYIYTVDMLNGSWHFKAASFAGNDILPRHGKVTDVSSVSLVEVRTTCANFLVHFAHFEV